MAEARLYESPRTRKQARPSVSTPIARASGIVELDILVDTRERYAYRFTGQQVRTTKRALPCGDYAVTVDDPVAAAVERKPLPDLVSSLTNGTLRCALGELSALPRAAVVVEDCYSQIFKLDRIRPAVVADGLAELQVRWPGVPIVFARPADWPRNGPTATSPPPTPGPVPRRLRSLASSRPAALLPKQPINAV